MAGAQNHNNYNNNNNNNHHHHHHHHHHRHHHHHHSNDNNHNNHNNYHNNNNNNYYYYYYYLFFFIFYFFSPTSTNPVGLKISYNMVFRLRWSALGKNKESEKVLRKATALPLCSVNDILWYRYVDSSGSLVIVVIRLPRSSMNSADCGHQAPLVSMAIGTKECVSARATYFVVSLTAAFSAAARVVVEVSCGCDTAYVSGTVTSQASGLLRVHGTRVAPSGLLQSALESPIGGSLLAGICAFLTARQIRSLSCE